MYPKKVIDPEVLKKWMLDYYSSNGKAPKSEDLTMRNGCPYGKTIIYKTYGTLENLCNSFGITSRADFKDLEDDTEILKQLRQLAIQERTTNREILRKAGARDRDYYTLRYGSWPKAIEMSCITNADRVLMKHFDDFNGENTILFLKQKIGIDGNFSKEQMDMINEVQSKMNGYSANKIQQFYGYYRIKKYFRYASILMIAAGIEPVLKYNTGKKYRAKDGHLCDSYQEMLLDNWLSDNGYIHKTQIDYPNSKLRCDFLVEDVYIEYAGLLNSGIESYVENIKRKINLCKEKRLKLCIVKNLSNKELKLFKAALESNLH